MLHSILVATKKRLRTKKAKIPSVELDMLMERAKAQEGDSVDDACRTVDDGANTANDVANRTEVVYRPATTEGPGERVLLIATEC